MQKQDFPIHWNFALVSAIYRLEYLIWQFDVIAETGTKAYVGVLSPDQLVAIIDGFLSERDQLFDGTIRGLHKMRNYLQQRLAPSYEAGRSAARKQWQVDSQEQRSHLAAFTVEDVRNGAWNAGPPDKCSSEANWFVEGFCYQWWHEEYLKFIVSTIDNR